MSTNKPKIVIYSDIETIEKLDILAKSENRSRGNMAESIIKNYIKSKEDKGRTIIVGRDNNGSIY